MSSACTLVGCGMRNITSCFFARRIRFEEKTDALSSRSPETSSGSIVFDFTGGGGGRSRKVAKKKSDGNSGKSVPTSPSRSKRINGGEAEPDVAEEEYLVFCFREDGAIDIINDGRHGDDDKDENENENENKNARAIDAIAIEKVDEKESKDYEIKEMKMDTFEACDSNLSDTSSGSFAFPILKIEEWIGSPVHMPKHENQSVRLHCCRF